MSFNDTMTGSSGTDPPKGNLITSVKGVTKIYDKENKSFIEITDDTGDTGDTLVKSQVLELGFHEWVMGHQVEQRGTSVPEGVLEGQSGEKGPQRCGCETRKFLGTEMECDLLPTMGGNRLNCESFVWKHYNDISRSTQTEVYSNVYKSQLQ